MGIVQFKKAHIYIIIQMHLRIPEVLSQIYKNIKK